MTVPLSTIWSAVEGWTLAVLLNSLWQVPLVFIVATTAARLARAAGPAMQHRVWVGALLLACALPLCPLRPAELGQQAWSVALWFLHAPSPSGETRVILGAGTAAGVALPWHSAAVLGALAALYLCSLLYFAARLGWGLLTTEKLRRSAPPEEPDGAAATQMRRVEHLFGIAPGSVRVASSQAIPGPATVGLRRPTLLLPLQFLSRLDAGDLDALLAHEFAHMRRHDFAKNLLYGIVSLPIAYHPITALIRARLSETRELVCDQMAAEAVGGRDGYARSLLNLARTIFDELRTQKPAPKILHAIGILDANIFERRVMHLTQRSEEASRGRRFAMATGCVLLALATCASALALHMDVKAPADQNPAPKSLHVKADALKIAARVQPVYPPEARKKHVQGTVELAATIGKDGTTENVRIISGPEMLQAAAMEAVRQWHYEPYLLNGDPVEVQTTIKVVYALGK